MNVKFKTIKTLFYIVLYFFYIQSCVCSSKFTFNDYVEQLTTVVKDYRKLVDPAFINDKSNIDFTSQNMIESFRENLKTIMKHLHNYRIQMLSRLEEIDTHVLQIVKKRKVQTKRNEFEELVCLSVPLFLDFIYDLTTEVNEFIDIYQMYIRPCVDWSLAVAYECDYSDEDTNTYYCSDKNIDNLYSYYKEFKERPLIPDYESHDTQFLKEAMVAVKGIDKIRMFTLLGVTNKKKVFDDLDREYFTSREGFLQYKPSDTKTEILNTTLQELNNDFAMTFSEDLTGFVEPADAVNKLLTRGFKMLETYFKYKIKNLYVVAAKLLPITRDVVTNEDMYDALDSIFNGLCEHASIILVYLVDNCSAQHVVEIKKSLGLQLMYCSRWRTVLSMRCPPVNGEPNADCIATTILSRLTMNIYSITGRFPIVNYEDYKHEDIDLVFGYLASVSNAVRIYYSDFTVPVWTRCDWMTGSLLMESDYSKSGVIDNLKEQAISVSTSYDNQKLNFALQDVYFIMLPWFPNLYNVFKFHEVLINYIELILNEFVYRHFKIVVMYFKHVNDTVEHEVLEKLSKSILWYSEGAEDFYKYLSFPAKPIPQQTVKDIISKIENLNQSSLQECNELLENIPKEKQNELTQWANVELKSHGGTVYEDKIRQMFLTNCDNAGTYLNILFNEAYKMLLIKKDPIKIFNHYCITYLDKIFDNGNIAITFQIS